jgi:hypothetical protein
MFEIKRRIFSSDLSNQSVLFLAQQIENSEIIGSALVTVEGRSATLDSIHTNPGNRRGG